MSDSTTVQSGDSTSAEPASRAKRRGRWGTWILLSWLAFVALGQYFVWNVMPDTHGPSIPNMITYSMGIVTALLVLAWLLFCSPAARKLAFPLAVLVYFGLIGGVVASIRNVHFSGDMKPTVTFRWEPTLEERLQSFDADAGGAAQSPSGDGEWTPAPHDAPDWRGPNRDGVVASPGFADDWQANPPQELWRRPCGEGYSPFVIVGPAVVTIEQRGPNEAIVCYDADSGQERWGHEYPARFSEAMGGVGPRAAPVIAGNDVYTMGAFGDLYCVDLSTGEPRWNLNILTANGLEQDGQPLNTVWAMSSAPLIVDDMVVVNAGGPVGDGLVAYNTSDGALLWQGAGLRNVIVSPDSINRAGYSSPQRSTIAGEEQILIFDGVGLRSCSPENGDELWFFPFEHGDSPGRVNVAQPLVLEGDRVFISASYSRGCDMLKVAKGDDGLWSAESIWDDKVKRYMRCKFSSPVLYNNYIYGLDEGFLTCLDAETGKRMWRKSRDAQYGHGQMLLTNGRIVLLSEYGELVLIAPSPEGLRELSKVAALPGEKTWNPLALARGRAYLRNHLEAVCLELPAQ